MLDSTHFQLLLDCDRYLERQHVLLERLAAAEAGDVVLAAMDSAFDQFLQAVTVGWQALADRLNEDPAPDPGRADAGRADPGRVDAGRVDAGRVDAGPTPAGGESGGGVEDRPSTVDTEGHPDGEIA